MDIPNFITLSMLGIILAIGLMLACKPFIDRQRDECHERHVNEFEASRVFISELFKHTELDISIDVAKHSSALPIKVQALDAQQLLVEKGYETELSFDSGQFVLTSWKLATTGQMLACKHLYGSKCLTSRTLREVSIKL